MHAALDISKKKIGIAISNCDNTAILWAGTIKNKTGILENLYIKYRPQISLVGLPTHRDGNLTFNGQFVKNFIQNNSFIHPFQYVDEYLSTQEANKIIENMKLKIEVDTLVAKIMIYKHLKIESALLYYGLYY